MAATAQAKADEAREVTITRAFDAPRAQVFRMWTDPAHLARWWGPVEFTNPVCEIDARPGGRMYIVMHGPKGTPYDADFPMSGTFHDVVAPERIVFTAFAQDFDGTRQLESLTTVTFVERDGRTILTVHARAVPLVPAGEPMVEGMAMGWTQSIDKLEALLKQTS